MANRTERGHSAGWNSRFSRKWRGRSAIAADDEFVSRARSESLVSAPIPSNSENRRRHGEADRKSDPFGSRDAGQHPANHQTREHDHHWSRRNSKRRAAGAHVAPPKLPRRETARAVEHECRDVRKNR